MVYLAAIAILVVVWVVVNREKLRESRTARHEAAALSDAERDALERRRRMAEIDAMLDARIEERRRREGRTE